MKTLFRNWMLGAALLFATTLGARAQVVMRGYIGFDIFRSDVVIYVENIANFGDTTTDRLRLRLWASDDHWTPQHPGRVLAVARVQKLKAGRDHDYVDREAHFSRPDTGWYRVALTLEERVIAEDGTQTWELRDAVEFYGEYFFREHTFNPFWPFD